MLAIVGSLEANVVDKMSYHYMCITILSSDCLEGERGGGEGEGRMGVVGSASAIAVASDIV